MRLDKYTGRQERRQVKQQGRQAGGQVEALQLRSGGPGSQYRGRLVWAAAMETSVERNKKEDKQGDKWRQV